MFFSIYYMQQFDCKELTTENLSSKPNKHQPANGHNILMADKEPTALPTEARGLNKTFNCIFDI
jgi:hypothetical protein